MNHDIAMWWADALESGEYQQTRSVLRGEDGFCCLGVLCDLHAEATGEEWEKTGDDWIYRHEAAVTPREVAEWAGGHNYCSHERQGPCLVDCAGMNDDGSTFAEIAAYIRENWERL